MVRFILINLFYSIVSTFTSDLFCAIKINCIKTIKQTIQMFPWMLNDVTNVANLRCIMRLLYTTNPPSLIIYSQGI